MEPKHRCKNCEEEFDASYKYCPSCGQNAKDQLTIRVLFNNTISNYFSVDARFFRSFFPLLFRPGVLARRFVDGKRQIYLHPAQFYLFISVIFFFIFSIATRNHENILDQEIGDINIGEPYSIKNDLKEEQTQLSDQQIESIDSILIKNNYSSKQSYSFTDSELDSLIKLDAPEEEKLKYLGYEESSGEMTKFFYRQGLKIYERRGGGLIKTFYDTIPISMFFLLPIFAFILKLFYSKSGRFSHHMVFSFYYFTFIFLFLSVLMLINFWIDLGWVNDLPIILIFIYLVVGSYHFYGQKWLKVFFKSVAVGLTYTLVVIPISVLIMILISFMVY